MKKWTFFRQDLLYEIGFRWEEREEKKLRIQSRNRKEAINLLFLEIVNLETGKKKVWKKKQSKYSQFSLSPVIFFGYSLASYS